MFGFAACVRSQRFKSSMRRVRGSCRYVPILAGTLERAAATRARTEAAQQFLQACGRNGNCCCTLHEVPSADLKDNLRRNSTPLRYTDQLRTEEEVPYILLGLQTLQQRFKSSPVLVCARVPRTVKYVVFRFPEGQGSLALQSSSGLHGRITPPFRRDPKQVESIFLTIPVKTVRDTRQSKKQASVLQPGASSSDYHRGAGLYAFCIHRCRPFNLL